MAFLQDVVSWRWTYFSNYESFYNMVNSSYQPEKLSSSAYDTKFYWGNKAFVRIGGYGACLPSDEYEQAKEEAIQRYQYQFSLWDKLSSEERYLYDEEQDINWVTEEYLIFYDIEEMESLILSKEQVTDYYVIASHAYSGGPIDYYDWVLCNDMSGRIIEITKTDRNPYDKNQ